MLDKENNEIKEHRQKRKECRNTKEREALGQWSPQIMENGKTMPQIMVRSRHIILKHKSKWNDRQKARAKILFQQFPDLEKGYRLLLDLVDIFNKKSIPDEAKLNLVRWYDSVDKFNNQEFNKVLDTFENHNVTIINYLENRLTNASAESFNVKIKALCAQFRGVGDIKFFMYPIAALYT